MGEVSPKFVHEAEAATAAPPSSASVPDVPLIALGEQWQEAYHRWQEAEPTGGSVEKIQAQEERLAALGNIAWKLEDQAAKVPWHRLGLTAR